MRQTLKNSQDEDRSSLLGRAALLFRDNACIRIPIVLVFIGIIGGVMLLLSAFVPAYAAVALVYLLGLLGWGFLIGFPRKEDIAKRGSTFVRLWVFFAFLWASALCLMYADALRQGHDSASTIWTLIGFGLAVPAVIVGRVFYTWKRPRRRDER